MAGPTQLNPTEQDALVKQIGLALLRAAPADWASVEVVFHAIGRYTEVRGQVSFADERTADVPIASEVVGLFARLRAGMYREGRGTWFNARYQLDRPAAYNLEYDRDEPAWHSEPPHPAFVDELRMFPREEENVPEWLNRRLVALTPPFRTARIFDGMGPGGRPVLNRPPLDDDEREQAQRYLDAAPLALPARGYDTDHLDDERRQTVPVAFHTDGAWIWPAAVNFYLRTHGVPPDPDLLAHVRRAEFHPPEVDEQARTAAAAFIAGPRRPNGRPQPMRADRPDAPDLAHPDRVAAEDVGTPTFDHPERAPSEEPSPDDRPFTRDEPAADGFTGQAGRQPRPGPGNHHEFASVVPVRHDADSAQAGDDSVQPAADPAPRGSDFVRPAAESPQHATDFAQPAAKSPQHATDFAQPAAESPQRETDFARSGDDFAQPDSTYPEAVSERPAGEFAQPEGDSTEPGSDLDHQDGFDRHDPEPEDAFAQGEVEPENAEPEEHLPPTDSVRSEGDFAPGAGDETEFSQSQNGFAQPGVDDEPEQAVAEPATGRRALADHDMGRNGFTDTEPAPHALTDTGADDRGFTDPEQAEPDYTEPFDAFDAGADTPHVSRHSIPDEPNVPDPVTADVVNRLRTRLDEMGVPEDRYTLGTPTGPAWTMEQTGDGWRVGWFDGHYVAPAVFSDAADAAAFLAGKVLLDPAPAAPHDPGPSTVRASLAELEDDDDDQYDRRVRRPLPPRPVQSGPSGEDLFRPTLPVADDLFSPGEPRRPRFDDDEDDFDHRRTRSAAEPSQTAAFGQAPGTAPVSTSDTSAESFARSDSPQHDPADALGSGAAHPQDDAFPQPQQNAPAHASFAQQESPDFAAHQQGTPDDGLQQQEPPPRGAFTPQDAPEPELFTHQQDAPDHDAFAAHHQVKPEHGAFATYQAQDAPDTFATQQQGTQDRDTSAAHQQGAPSHDTFAAHQQESERGAFAHQQGEPERGAFAHRQPSHGPDQTHDSFAPRNPGGFAPNRAPGPFTRSPEQPAQFGPADSPGQFAPRQAAEFGERQGAAPVREHPTDQLAQTGQDELRPEPGRKPDAQAALRRPQDWPIQPTAGEPPLTLFRGKQLTELTPGTELDRYGDPTGNLAYAVGTPFDRRSLVPDWINRPYRAYRVARPTEALTGAAIPWFDQPGGGTAYVLAQSVAELLDSGHLVEIPDRQPPARA